ncbi:MAG: hypothetical protein IJN34_07585, partial [Clostridia bacterium]|nr:hypothetical protein [Clostridia bacterium]
MKSGTLTAFRSSPYRYTPSARENDPCTAFDPFLGVKENKGTSSPCGEGVFLKLSNFTNREAYKLLIFIVY